MVEGEGTCGFCELWMDGGASKRIGISDYISWGEFWWWGGVKVLKRISDE